MVELDASRIGPGELTYETAEVGMRVRVFDDVYDSWEHGGGEGVIEEIYSGYNRERNPIDKRHHNCYIKFSSTPTGYTGYWWVPFLALEVLE